MASILKQRRDTAANWTSANPVIPDGQLCFDTTNNTFRIGDGTTVHDSLPIQSGVPGADGGLQDIVDDTTPQLGGDLDLNGNDITGTGAIPSANLSGALPAIDGSSLTGVNIYPTSSSHLFATSDAQNIDTALSAGTYIFVSVTRSGVAQSEVGYIVSDGSTLTTVSHASQTGSIDWTNPSGTTLRIRDVNNDKELLVFGWRIR